MKEVSLTLNLLPVGKGRPRLGRRGKHTIVFTPPKTAQFERAVAALLRNYLGPLEPMTGGVEVRLEFYFPKPKRPTHPFPSAYDVDNLAKAVCDAANGIVWKDDNQIQCLLASKHYGEPRIEFHAEAV